MELKPPTRDRYCHPPEGSASQPILTGLTIVHRDERSWEIINELRAKAEHYLALVAWAEEELP